MSLKIYRYIFGCALIISALNCANKGNITGGAEDIEPPKIVRTVPENYTTNFTGNEIRIYFNEYIKINDLQKQLIISPPMEPQPTITPAGSASKFIKIIINDTLSPNTTYAFNFGQSIEDNNEGNPYPYFKYVFSTGKNIDSLMIKGQITSAGKRETDEFVSVMLYEYDSTYTDSIIYKERPRYITNTLDSTTVFSLENLKPGKYKLVAIKDENSNYLFEQKTDKIGFYEGVVTVPTDSFYNITIFQERLDDKILRTKQVAGQKIAFGYEGNYEEINIEMLEGRPTDLESRITKHKTADTLYYWYKPEVELDTTYFAIRNNVYLDTLIHRFRKLERDSLILSGVNSGSIDFGQKFGVEANIPLISIDESKISIRNKDSIEVPFVTSYDSLLNSYTFDFEKQEAENYKVEIMPETFEDFFGNYNDTLVYTIRTKEFKDYSNVRTIITGVEYPVIVQLVNDAEEVKYQQILTEPKPLDFRNIRTGNYFLRVIVDKNNNGKWDSGNFLRGIQPEEIYYYDRAIDARANFDYVETFPLSQSRPDPLKN